MGTQQFGALEQPQGLKPSVQLRASERDGETVHRFTLGVSHWFLRGAAWVLWAAMVLGVSAVGAQAATGSYFAALAGSMTTARAYAVAAPLPDGRVLIAGGANGISIVSSAEVFDPARGSFTALPRSMTTARAYGVAAPLPDGRVLIAGGDSSSGVLSSAEVFDRATGSFTATGSMTTPRDFAVAAPLPHGRVLIAGGDDDNRILSSAEVFDPATGSFTATGSMTTPREAAAAAPLLDGRVLIAGGDNDSGTVSSAEVFDPATGSFATLDGSTSVRESAVTATLPDGRALIAGGGGSDSSAEVFDPATGSFTGLAGLMTTLRQGAVGAPLTDGRVLIAGGWNGISILSSAEVFESAPEAVVAGGDFGDQTVAQASPSQPLVVTNLGAQALSLSGASLAAGFPDRVDYAITADACAGRTLTFEQNCTISVQFTPSAAGARPAELVLEDNEPAPAKVPLTGTGVAAKSGPVQQPAGRLTISSVLAERDGRVRLRGAVSARGRLDVMETAWNDNPTVAYQAMRRRSVLLKPAPGRFVFARSHISTASAGAFSITIVPATRGADLVLHHRYRVTLRLWVTYTPVGGSTQTLGYYGLHLNNPCPTVTVAGDQETRAHCR